MAVLTIRNIDEDLKRNLRVAAAERGVSMEAYVRTLLHQAHGQELESLPLVDRICARFQGLEDLPLELPARDEPARWVSFEA